MATGSGQHGVLAALIDPELEILAVLFPAWRISQMGTMIRADKDGEKSRFAQTPSVLAAALADAEHAARASRGQTCPGITDQ
jgi:hypothetical protein